MRRINVLHLRDSSWVDGPGRTILQTAVNIDSDKYGYYIGAFCRRHSLENVFYKEAVERKLNVFRIEESHSFDPTIICRIKQLIESENVNIIHTHEVRSDVVGLIAGKITKRPVISTLHGWIQNGLKGKLYTTLDKSILPFFDHLIAVSERMKEDVIRIGVSKEKVSVLHNALVIDNYKRDRSDSTFRKQIGIDDGMYLIGNIGRLSPEKGHVDFLAAAAEVLKNYKNIKFVLIGSGSEESNLRKIIEELNIGNSVIFAGYRNDMLTVYNSLDLVVQSSYTEGMPNVVLEALAMEVPVIATDVGGTSEAIISNETGILIQPRDPRKLAMKIIQYLKNTNSVAAMVINGRKLVETKFDFTERTKMLSNIYTALMKKKA